MENRSSSSTLPANYVTIKDLKERWLKRRQEQEPQQQLQKEQQETENDKGKNHQRQSECGSPTRSLHADGVNRVEEKASSGRVRPGRGAGKSGRIGWEYGGGRGDGKPESGRWWSYKEGRGNEAEEENRAVMGACSTNQEEALRASGSSGKGLRDNPVRKSQGLVMDNVLETDENSALEKADGENAPSMNGVGEESMSKSNGVSEKELKGGIVRRKKPKKKTYRRERAFPGKVLNGAADEPQDQATEEAALSRKGMADLSKSKNKGAVVENGEMVAGDGVPLKKGNRNRPGRKKKFEAAENAVAAAASHGKALLEGAAEKSVPFRKGARDKSKSKSKNIVKDNQVDAAEASSSGGLRDENDEIKSKSMLVQNELKVEGAGELVLSEVPNKERTTAKSKKGKQSNRKIKSEKDVSVERMVTEVEAGPRGRDVIPENLSPEIDEQFRNMSTADKDTREAGPRPVRKDRGRFEKESRGRFGTRREVSYWMGGEMVWVKKEDTASGGESLHSSASLELPK